MGAYPSLDELRERLDDLDTDLELGPAAQVEALSKGHKYGGDVCPACGSAIPNDETVVRSDGERGTVWDLARDDVSVPLFCPECWGEVEATINEATHQTLDSFEGGE